jgi:pimeloyl-ACP methyl ester carboxylesterase
MARPTRVEFSTGGDQLLAVKGGSGNPLLVLHEELGHPGWLGWHGALSRRRTLLIPLHPGFGQTPRVDWVTNIRDLACFYGRFLREESLAPIDVIGFSFGGWLAAEMAANDPHLFRKMTLVAPMGIRPPKGEIMDMYTVTARAYLQRTVLDPAHAPEFSKLYGGGESPEQYEAFEDARAEAARIAWQPYMFNPSLPHLLEGVSEVPALLVWGRQDAVVPVSAADVYHRALRDSRLAVFDRSGHRPEIEKPVEFINQVESFFT